MSPENVELVRSVYQPWERGDFSSTEWAHPEIEFVMHAGPASGSCVGQRGLADLGLSQQDVHSGL